MVGVGGAQLRDLAVARHRSTVGCRAGPAASILGPSPKAANGAQRRKAGSEGLPVALRGQPIVPGVKAPRVAMPQLLPLVGRTLSCPPSTPDGLWRPRMPATAGQAHGTATERNRARPDSRAPATESLFGWTRGGQLAGVSRRSSRTDRPPSAGHAPPE